jgi:hypothetical protein
MQVWCVCVCRLRVYFSNLTELDLSSNNIRNDGAYRLIEFLRCVPRPSCLFLFRSTDEFILTCQLNRAVCFFSFTRLGVLSVLVPTERATRCNFCTSTLIRYRKPCASLCRWRCCWWGCAIVVTHMCLSPTKSLTMRIFLASPKESSTKCHECVV